MKRAAIAVSVGCPSGTGPELSVLAAATADASCLLVGDIEVLRRAASIRQIDPNRLCLVETSADVQTLEKGRIGVWAASKRLSRLSSFGAPIAQDGAAQLAWIEEAMSMTRRGIVDALVTGPVSKHAIATSGAAGAAGFSGHTEWLAERLGAREVVMAFHSAKMTTALVTTHLPLARVPEAITPEAVATTCYWIVRLLVALGYELPRVAIAALNPHAGEGGLLGNEETTQIAPGVRKALQRLAADGYSAVLQGPIGAETAFRKHASGDYDGVVAMYHDQATIPSKLVGFGKTVNVTLGLPIVRTSVDHGTGYDIAGQALADPEAMQHAMELAIRLSQAKDRASLMLLG
jgi:4-hydroxythreonine-4-phosphate dehydrogenase